MVSLPLGILLALGRRSRMPAVRLLSVIFIEFVRGVPLVTVLFMASVMLPLFVPRAAGRPTSCCARWSASRCSPRPTWRRWCAPACRRFRRASTRARMAVGLGYWQMMRLIVLPQALKITIPNIVNTYIGLFKDTTLVFIVGIFDFLRTDRSRAHRSEMGDAVDQHDRLCLRRDVLFHLLLRHVALCARDGSAARARATGVEATDHDQQPKMPDAAQAGAARQTDVAVEMVGVHKWYGDFHVLRDINLDGQRRRAHRDLRAVGLRQVDHDPLHQPAGGASARAASSSTASS